MSRYNCVDDQKAAGFPVTAACEAAGVSTSGYYDWLERRGAELTERQVAEDQLVELMQNIFDASDGNYGVPRVWKELRRAGLVVNKKKVRRLMRREGMIGRHHRRKLVTTFPGPDGYVIPDLVGRRFDPGAPDVAWCQDITYIPTGEGWLYLASVLDLGSRRLLGYSMAEHMRAELACDALTMAHKTGLVEKFAIFHSDRGAQYTSADFRSALESLNMRASMGRVGSCYDNAVAESFFATLKAEIGTKVWATRADARRAVFAYLNYYNRRRLHSAAKHQTPYEARLCYRQPGTVAA